jgi:hypothetical protein
LPEVAVAFDATELSEQLSRLSKLLGFDQTDFQAHSANVRILTELRQQGCEFLAHILPAAEQAAKSGRAKTLGYIRPRAIELRDAAKIAASLPVAIELTDELGWRNRLRVWGERKGWIPKWGPDPSQPDCRCPSTILAEVRA